jgi:hypothetical protein
MSSEKREFRMSPALLWKVIHDQAGTISKAILEGAMNSVDAGATRCDITITPRSFSIKDDGKGFVDDTEIYRFFESFGEEHVEGDARYGRFRMGRGQIMAFGHNRWRTGTKLMDVNLKPQGNQKRDDKFKLGYDLTSGLPMQKGCSIEVDLYEENYLRPSELDRMVDEIARYVKYIDIPVTVNGKVVSVDPATQTWDIETDDAWIKRKATGDLTVYNLGSLVKTVPAWQTSGMAGVVVSKKQLKVNFARNDVQSDCPVWRRITKVMRDISAGDVKKNKPLDDNTRYFYAKEFAAGEGDFDALLKMRLLTDVTGAHHPVEALLTKAEISAAPKSHLVGETAHTRKLAFVLSQATLERFGVETVDEFKRMLQERCAAEGSPRLMDHLRPVPLSEFSKVISAHHEPLKLSELNGFERLCVSMLNEVSKRMFFEGKNWDRRTNLDVFAPQEKYRTVHAGRSQTALAWTNGKSEIWFERDYMRRQMRQGYAGMLALVNTMLHEYVHREADTASHDHGIEFYEAFHEYNIRTDIVASCTDRLMSRVVAEARKKNERLLQNVLTHVDRVEGASRVGVGSYEGFVAGGEEETPEWTEPAEAPVQKAALAAVPPAARPAPRSRFFVHPDQDELPFAALPRIPRF